eukprot:gene16891-18597_t
MKSILTTLGVLLFLTWRSVVRGEGEAIEHGENELTAEALLHTIAPTYNLARVPPGFPPLSKMNTDSFNYKTGGRYIKVVAKLNDTVKMVEDYVELTDVIMNFNYDKQQPVNGTWRFTGKGVMHFGANSMNVTITEGGEIEGEMEYITFKEIIEEMTSDDDSTEAPSFDSGSVKLKNVTVSGKVAKKDGFFYIVFKGYVARIGGTGSPATGSITISKSPDRNLNAFAILEFKNLAPSTVLNELIDDETLDVPFMLRMLSNSDLLSSNKTQFGVSLSLNDVYNLNYNTTTGGIFRDVLQSHVPSGVTFLCPVDLYKTKKVSPVKLAFVIKQPNFDFLVDKHDKITLRRILKALSAELTPPSLPVFLKRTKQAFTSHISFNSDTLLFSIFVKLKEEVGLAPGVLRSRVKSIVLVKNISKPDSDDWKLSVKGALDIGDATMKLRYAQMGSSPEKVYGMTAVAKSLSLEDIVNEFDPMIYANEDAKQMIENTEVDDFVIDNASLFSRITRTNTPHLLLTGHADLPAWEKRVKVSLLLLLDKKQWYMKIALTLTHSPLSNIMQALTGFDSRGTSLLHNNNIITSLISSPLPSYSFLPPKIITTPVLRLPVAKGVTLVALFRFPDNCGDDKVCQAARKLISTKDVLTFRGVMSLDGFQLVSPIRQAIDLGNRVELVNNTLSFDIGNDTNLDLFTTMKIRGSKFVFDGRFSFLRNGLVRMTMDCRKKTWIAPFGITFIQFKNLTLNSTFNPGDTLNWVKLEGLLRLGAMGNGNELTAPLSLDFNPATPEAGRFYANFTAITIADLLTAFTINYELPYVLRTAFFPHGLMLSYSAFEQTEQENKADLHGDIKILGRVLSCKVHIVHPTTIHITTSNSPAPVILGNGQIIIQQDAEENSLRGPRIIASIDHKEANVTMTGYVKTMGMESKVNVTINEDGLAFKIDGKMMDFKNTELSAESHGSLDNFKVSGCFDEIAEEVEILLIEILSKAGNQSSLNIRRAEENLDLAGQYFENADRHEADVRLEKEELRRIYEDHLLDYGRSEVRVNETCRSLSCEVTCFGCPEWKHCCHRDIFGECIKCANWRKCCWKDVDPVCIAEEDGCRIIRAVAEAQLSDRELQLEEQRMHLDKLEALAVDAEENKGKHKAVLEAAIDAKRLVVEDSGAGLNAADAAKNFGPFSDWVKIKSVCYNTSLEEAATGCMYFHVRGNFFKDSETAVSIGSCLKEELVNELAESLANYMFPGLVDTSTDDVTDVKADDTRSDESALFNADADSNSSGDVKTADNRASKGSDIEQDALYQRRRRSVNDENTKTTKKSNKSKNEDNKSKQHEKKTKQREKKSEILDDDPAKLLENPFWNMKFDDMDSTPRSHIAAKPVKKQFMRGMLHKRWKIPENAAGRCHIFHQLVDICKDMADTIILMDKSLSTTVKKYKKEKGSVTEKSTLSLEFLAEAAKKVQLNDTTLSAVDQTLQVVNQGIDIWASKCEKELNWQNAVGVQTWLRSMDQRIQQLGGFGVYRFLENLFHAFEALFEAATYSDENADEALTLLQRIRKVSTGFDRIFREKLPVRTSQMYANEILHHLNALKHETLFCT